MQSRNILLHKFFIFKKYFKEIHAYEMLQEIEN